MNASIRSATCTPVSLCHLRRRRHLSNVSKVATLDSHVQKCFASVGACSRLSFVAALSPLSCTVVETVSLQVQVPESLPVGGRGSVDSREYQTCDATSVTVHRRNATARYVPHIRCYTCVFAIDVRRYHAWSLHTMHAMRIMRMRKVYALARILPESKVY